MNVRSPKFPVSCLLRSRPWSGSGDVGILPSSPRPSDPLQRRFPSVSRSLLAEAFALNSLSFRRSRLYLDPPVSPTESEE
ncbi:hypothetical protein MUK42_37120 [Musa troglodytarum]|uniref:Uncharacterized protein n=1 Tax=Musa troglodytarum TaxID=320322 RepID=A0A9E7EHG3_9LILI|nr:hypothetical protein MUK42_37120 [Musa troglodytarum]